VGLQTDTLIIGCGIAGATSALKLSDDRERQITVVTRAVDVEDSNSSYAQGGIVSLGRDDTRERLAEDVVRAGAGLSSPSAVAVLVDEGPALLQELLVDRLGVEFDREPSGEPAFGLEGAHSTRRILHVGDATGRAIMKALLGELRARPNVRLLTGHTAIDLLTFPHHALDRMAIYEPPVCHGAYVFDRAKRRVKTVIARHTVLATGGLGQIFLCTTNPGGARGDGVAMAYRAGARVINSEFMQFHPTALHMPGTTKTLISEAVRGEGGVLLTPDGDPFMEHYEPAERELAPRDAVSRAIYTEMLSKGYPYVLLDIATRQPADYIRGRFPEIHARCLEHNIDITGQPIPVVPAAHYACGGVLVDLRGRTTLNRLYAVGEVACTGVHGANRLASTSLLEGLVWGTRTACDIRERKSTAAISERDVPPWDESATGYEADPALVQGDMQSVRSLMWHYVGLLRNKWRLRRATQDLRRLWSDVEDFYRTAHLTDALIGLRNMVLSAVIVARSATQNRTSRGCHYREDNPPPSRGAASPDGTNDLDLH
jgi:L-aspartate oxidase